MDEITIDDPDVFEEPWKYKMVYLHRPSLRLMEYVCLENNRNVDADGRNRLMLRVTTMLRRAAVWSCRCCVLRRWPKGSPNTWAGSSYGDGGAAWQTNKQQLQRFGEQFESALEMYEYLEQHADGGDELTWADMGKPEFDWSGIYTRTRGGLSFDPDIRANELTAKLTPAGAAARERKIEQLASTGGEYDPISDCRPPGHPRWATEPFLHEFIVTPNQTWLVNEMVNDTRRVYTDGRAHTAPEDAYATWNGDTIGFWDDEHVGHAHDVPPGWSVSARYPAELL